VWFVGLTEFISIYLQRRRQAATASGGPILYWQRVGFIELSTKQRALRFPLPTIRQTIATELHENLPEEAILGFRFITAVENPLVGDTLTIHQEGLYDATKTLQRIIGPDDVGRSAIRLRSHDELIVDTRQIAPHMQPCIVGIRPGELQKIPAVRVKSSLSSSVPPPATKIDGAPAHGTAACKHAEWSAYFASKLSQLRHDEDVPR
jgi:hypothetical protein